MNVVIVDPFSSGRHLAPMLKASGTNVSAIISSSSLADFYLNSLNKNDFDNVLYFQDNEQDVRSFIKNNSPKYIIAGSEPGVDLANILAQENGLICHDLNRRNARRNKFDMQTEIAKNNLRSIKQHLVANYDDTLKWVDNKSIHYPIIVKPIKSAGTDGVAKIHNETEAKQYFDKMHNTVDVMGEKNKVFVAQEFIDGIEYVVDAISINKKHHIVAVWQYTKSNKNGYVTYDKMELLKRNETPSELIEYNDQVLSALGIVFGPTHNEIFIDKLGPVLCESGARIHGGMGPLLAKKAIGFNQIELTAKLLSDSLTENDLLRWSNTETLGHAIEIFGQNDKLGKLKNSYVPNSSVDSEFKLVFEIGHEITPTRDLITSPSRLLLTGNNKAALESEYNNFRQWESKIGYV